MPYVTSIERLAEARGEARGQARAVLKQLWKVFGSVSEEHQEQVRRLQSESLDQLAEDLLQFESLADLQKWLDQHAGTND
jgi:hypothetical protein